LSGERIMLKRLSLWGAVVVAIVVAVQLVTRSSPPPAEPPRQELPAVGPRPTTPAPSPRQELPVVDVVIDRVPCNDTRSGELFANTVTVGFEGATFCACGRDL
jgi:hypothetical protein